MNDTKQPEAMRLADALTEDQWLDLAERYAAADWDSGEPDGYLNAVKALCIDFAALASAAAQPPAGWWRQRADEIELEVAQGKSSAMRCYTDMRALLQAAAAPNAEPAQPAGEYPTMPPRHYVVGNESVWCAAQMRAYADATCAKRAAQFATADNRAAFKAYLEDCDECAIVPDIAGAFNAGWTSCVSAEQPAGAQAAPAAVAATLTKLQRKAIAVCFTSDKVSVSEVQRKLSISYADAQTLCQSVVDLGLAGELALAPSLKRGAPAPQEALVAQGDAETALRKVLSVVQRYLPPDGIGIEAAMAEIIETVDPWPLGDQKGKA